MDFNTLCKDKNHQIVQTLVIYDSSSLISDPDHLQIQILEDINTRIASNVLTYSAVNSCVPTGMQ